MQSGLYGLVGLLRNICSVLPRAMSPHSAVLRLAMARALNRAAEHFDNRQGDRPALVGWREGHPDDDSPVVAHTLPAVAGQLRLWAARACQ
jgi:hypothetical protein